MKYYCPCCEENVGLFLEPDYSSSGIWCNNCGAELANPESDLIIVPLGVLALLKIWNALWELQVCAEKENRIEENNFKNLFIESGIYLASQINNFYDCKFIPNDFIFQYLDDGE
jgi:hypothetical protein